MSAQIAVIDPTAPFPIAEKVVRRSVSSLSGQTIGIIDNSKPNFNELADDLADLLQSRYGAKAVIKHRKGSATMPASDDAIRQLAAQCALVIAGSGD
jgi:hypothetical protein